ncbi:hypothetical protein SADUNF_Sadunf17G0094100 [Salix dunnii]|uniref:Protein kinase domain-containing protein n=1 Tax=Salix dunnii TaxID=1413687 RepID=A0A835J3E1_9ROSI|nr:hypothetical protein SADUNF_Sadunf17G0094100 [Salix dunnii]
MSSSSYKYLSPLNSCISTPLYLTFLLLHLTILVTGVSPQPYLPLDNIALNCGSPSESSVSGRNWTADINSSKVALLDQDSGSIQSTANDQASTSTVPYHTARVSRSKFTYIFPVTATGPKFVRLHFYPASYPGFNRSKASFSVTSGRYTFLSNFSGVHYTDPLGDTGYAREFILNVEDERKNLSITFTPSPHVADAYAFINGIEIVSMPTNLYYTAVEMNNFDKEFNSYPLQKEIDLEMMYRVNVGGDEITPPKDTTGMFRRWLNDIDYLTDARPSALHFNGTIQLKYDNYTRYAAPDDLYRTVRTMGPNYTVNAEYNMTWEFPVHSVRIIPIILKNADLAFNIYIANQTAERYADIISWASGYGIPVYKDYLGMMDARGNEEIQNLSIALHPVQSKNAFDAMLNGVEIFKLSKSDNLSGPNPGAYEDSPTSATSSKPKHSRRRTAIIFGAAVSGIVVVSVLFFLIFRRRVLKFKEWVSGGGTSKLSPALSSSTKSIKTQRSSLPFDLCHNFSLAEIIAATKNFDDSFIIGVGGFGNVYKGLFDGGVTRVAIKRLNPSSRQGATEFKTEIEMLSQLRFRHLVSLIGYCNENNEMILVYDYMARGTLRDHLKRTDNPPLSWTQRLEICIGAARGLHYLHTVPASLAELARQSHSNGTINEIIDPYLDGKISPDCLKKFVEVAVRCLLQNGIERPSMTDVVWGLEFALQLQESAEEYVKGSQTKKEVNMESPLKGSSIDSSSDLFSVGSELVVNSRILEMATTSSSDEQSFQSNESEKMMSGAVSLLSPHRDVMASDEDDMFSGAESHSRSTFSTYAASVTLSDPVQRARIKAASPLDFFISPSPAKNKMSSSSYKYLYLYLTFLLLHLTILVTGDSPQTYLPLDNIALDCGSSSESSVSDRNWTADINSKVALLDQDSGSIQSTANEASTNPVPYDTARVSRSKFTYTFPVTATGPKFVRLHFYPASYPGFNRSKASFSVTTGRYTFLSNFSGVHYTEPHGDRGYAREFILNVEDERKSVSITFTPSPHVADAYAFINGIEIVSMPTDLYCTAGDDKGLYDVGKGGQYSALKKETALEIMYRVNVGGREITPPEDSTGMFRRWLEDTNYLTDARPSVFQFNGTIQLQYDNHTLYAAPEELYRTARTMGPDGTVNERYNMTWEFPVHSTFTYLVRLHFCSFIPIIFQKGDPIFQIYIANQTAELYADIVYWADGNGVPIYKDYAVMMHARGIEELQNLSIALHPSPHTFSFSDAMLNGVEIFKLSKSDNLSGPNPSVYLDGPSSTSPPSVTSSKPKHSRRRAVTIFGAVVSGIVVSVLFFLIFQRRVQKFEYGFLLRSYQLQTTSTIDSLLVLVALVTCKNDYLMVRAKRVAIKRLNPSSQQGATEFKTEIEMLSQLRFRHLNNEMILVYKYLYLTFLLLHLTILVTGDSPQTYPPLDNIALDCGSSSESSVNDRNWTADINSKVALLDQDNGSIQSTANPAPTDPEPYHTARVSRSKFTYTFPVTTTGPKFVRLHFYPASYPGFNRSKASFSVTTGRYTFLSNFSGFHFTEPHGDRGYAREFILNVEDERKNMSITFTPSPHVAGAYAFINGIEIVSMPTDLYYTAGDYKRLYDFGKDGQNSPLQKETALEMMYRVNVGGNDIEPRRDSGMFRRWLDDIDYLTDFRTSVLQFNGTIQLQYDNHTRYAAPEELYRTARTMGLDGTVNERYNMTWEFPVHSTFTYLVRLHFCSFIPIFFKKGDPIFEIYIANQTAELNADIVYWAGGNGVPIYKDYAVMMHSRGIEELQNLSIALHPSPHTFNTSDAMLNGVEIFKLSKSDNLSGPNPGAYLDSPSSTTPPTATSSKPKHSRRRTITIFGAAVSGIVVVSVLFFLIFRRRVLKLKEWVSGGGTSKLSPAFSSSTKSIKTRRSSLPFDLCHNFSLAEIIAATKNFDDSFIIGVGGFGNVYKGLFDGGVTRVAIKRLNPSSQQGATEFKTEIEMLSQLRFRHLVSLIGYCNENNEMILVYDYMARGTLRDHLKRTDNPPLSWTQRLEICIGAARGLHYLHTAVPASLAELARQSHSNGTINEIIDPYLDGKISPDCLKKFVEVAVRCLLENGIERPSMTDVVWGLEFALQLQESAVEYVKGSQTTKEVNMESPLKGSSIDSSSDLFSVGSELVVNSRILEVATTSSSDEQSFQSNDSEKMMSGAVFSEIMNSKGR